MCLCKLLLSYGARVRSILSEPAGAVSVQVDGPAKDKRWHSYTLHGEQWGRARLVVTHADGTVQSSAYHTMKPEQQAVADMGHFLFHDQ